jgi:hypothetical protein
MKTMNVSNTIPNGIKLFMLKESQIHNHACTVVALQLLNNCANGSPGSPVKPPIWTGYLRGSGSVFVNGKFISATPGIAGSTPLRQLAIQAKGTETIISVVYNTDYAAWLHEEVWKPGAKSVKAGNVGNKWIERHLNADGAELMWLYGKILKKELYKD